MRGAGARARAYKCRQTLHINPATAACGHGCRAAMMTWRNAGEPPQ